MKNAIVLLTVSLGLAVVSSASAVDNLLINPGFREVFPEPVDAAVSRPGWTNSGDVYYFAFFGENPHASFFADTIFHEGRLEQEGIVATPGTTYQFDMMDTRIEANFSPDFVFGLEYYGAGDVKIGETISPLNYQERLNSGAADPGDGAVNGATFSIQGTAVPGTITVRPVMQYDNVTVPGNQTNAFLFNTHMSVAPGVGDEALKNAGFEDTDGDGFQGDFWRSFGAAGFGDDFSGGGDPNGHATLFAETAGNSGGVYQQSILGTAGTEYEFSLTDVRIEANVNGTFEFGFEYYGSDDFTKLGESFAPIDIATTGDGLSFTTSAVAVAGTTFVRPVVKYSDVLTTNPVSGARLFVFDASVTELSSTVIAGDYDGSGQVGQGDLDLVLLNWGGTAPPVPAGWVNDQPDGLIGQTQLDGVLLNWGNTSLQAASANAVPEPQSLLLVAMALGLLSTATTRWQSRAAR